MAVSTVEPLLHPRRVAGRFAVMVFLATLAAAVSLVVALRPWPRGAGPGPAWAWLASEPRERAAVGPIRLDGSAAGLIARLGPPDLIGPDIEGVSRQWFLPGDALLSVTTPVDALEPVYGVVAVVPAGSPVRFGLYGGLVLGDATIADVVRAWGTPDRFGAPTDDFDVRYVECRGVFPIVLKVQSDAAFDRVLVAYADEAPGSGGCDDGRAEGLFASGGGGSTMTSSAPIRRWL